jgi:hypothetical protein
MFKVGQWSLKLDKGRVMFAAEVTVGKVQFNIDVILTDRGLNVEAWLEKTKIQEVENDNELPF